ncbi:uncharacterized protein N7459_000253 [Penicillium hispanicum]|uniref:uncharacterized protein n=1 Tax=Penicillium hispanicum TaxID=1080232 RepID=UPI002542136D|nr:uncharacterized protein N7459_000253 [Penicillium hispanicum]KAJ5594045.1 hypothetical protein N7459_000253 [Penicillium hispanicum]
MDCGASKMPNNACFPARIQTHVRNQGSNSSSLSHDAIPIGEPIPSPRRWSPTYQPRRRSRQFPTSLSFVPSPAAPRLESHDYSTSLPRRPAERGPVCISPFRSVRRMKEPFQLMLPSSPASCDGTSTFPSKPTRESKPSGGHTLRTWRSDQNLTSAGMAAFGLLPSPPMSESRPASTGPESSYFEVQEKSKEGGNTISQAEPDYIPEMSKNVEVEDMHYHAYRPPDWKEKPQEHRRTDVTNVHEAHSNLVRQYESEESKLTATPPEKQPSSTASPSVRSGKGHVPGSSPKPQRPRTATVSSEASWIPSNLAYCETWLQGVPLDPLDDKDDNPSQFNRRRKCQIVEKDPPMPKFDISPGARALDEPVRLAVASKPKLVDIARQSSPYMPPPPSLSPHPLPMTPDQRQEEVSAFSPDTPLNMSDSGYGTRESGYSIDGYTDSKDDDAYTDPGSLTSDSVTSTVVCERPVSAQGERDTSPQPEIRSGSVSPKASSPKQPSPARESHSPHRGGPENQRSWDHEWTHDDHEWTLDELDHSVKDFPRHMLRLTSPVIVFLRQSDEKALLRPFRTIFPQVAENLLDCLCAALIARNYLLSLSTIHRHKPSLSARNDIYGVDAVPTKAYSTLGIQLPAGSPGRIKGRVLGSRSSELRREVERIVDNLLFAICGRADETLKSAVEVLAQVLETTAN